MTHLQRLVVFAILMEEAPEYIREKWELTQAFWSGGTAETPGGKKDGQVRESEEDIEW